MSNYVITDGIQVINVIVSDSIPDNLPTGQSAFEATDDNISANQNLTNISDFFPSPPVIDINALSQEIQNNINNYRDNIVLGGATVWYNGYEYDCDQPTQINLSGVVTYILTGASLPSDFVWRDYNNNNIPQTTDSMVQFGVLMAQYVNIVYAASWALKENVQTIATQSGVDNDTIVSQLSAIDITQGWPSNDLTPSVAHISD